MAVVPFDDRRQAGEMPDPVISAFVDDVVDRLARFHTLTILNRETALAVFREIRGDGLVMTVRPDFFVHLGSTPSWSMRELKRYCGARAMFPPERTCFRFRMKSLIAS